MVEVVRIPLRLKHHSVVVKTHSIAAKEMSSRRRATVHHHPSPAESTSAHASHTAPNHPPPPHELAALFEMESSTARPSLLVATSGKQLTHS